MRIESDVTVLDIVWEGPYSLERVSAAVNLVDAVIWATMKLESVTDSIAKECTAVVREKVLKNEIDAFDGERLQTLKTFVTEYPSFHFDDAEKLLARTPKNAVKAEQFAQALIPIRISKRF